MDKLAPPIEPHLDAGKFHPENAEKSWTLPAEWYYDPAVYRQEHEAIFYRTWSYQCHVSDVESVGDFYCGEIADQGVFIIRGSDGELRAFYNVCSHRAHPLLEGQGNTRLIVCPYHQWCYQPDGRFRSARGRDALKGWIPDNADLKPVRLENFGGFLFVNLDSDVEPLADLAAKLLRDMKDYCPQLEGLVRAARFERPVAANWKTVIDNNHECYHCAVNHPALMEIVNYESESEWSDDGITFSHAVRGRHLNQAAYVLESGEAEQESLFGYIWPNTIPLFFPGTPSAVMFQVIPTGPETCKVRHDFYFIDREIGVQEKSFIDYINNVLVVEDMGLCERVQKGLHSRGYQQGKFVVDRSHCEFSEHHVHLFQRFVFNALVQFNGR